jgi:hypothetical protein
MDNHGSVCRNVCRFYTRSNVADLPIVENRPRNEAINGDGRYASVGILQWRPLPEIVTSR